MLTFICTIIRENSIHKINMYFGKWLPEIYVDGVESQENDEYPLNSQTMTVYRHRSSKIHKETVEDQAKKEKIQNN